MGRLEGSPWRKGNSTRGSEARAEFFRRRMERRKIWVAWICVVLVFSAVGCGGDATAGAFHEALWKQPARYCTKSPRAQMVNDLIDQHLKAGMPMNAVHALLGPPDQTDGPTLDYYNVDYEHTSMLGDCVFLEVESNDGQLRHAAVVRDG
jgi:hypothetical protein